MSVTDAYFTTVRHRVYVQAVCVSWGLSAWSLSGVAALITALLHPPPHSLLSSLSSFLLSLHDLAVSPSPRTVSYSLSVHRSPYFVLSLSHTSSPPLLLSFQFLQPSLSLNLFLPYHSIYPLVSLSVFISPCLFSLHQSAALFFSSPLHSLSNVSLPLSILSAVNTLYPLLFQCNENVMKG